MQPEEEEERHYPEVVQLRVTLSSPSTDLGVVIEVYDDDRVVAIEVEDGPLYRSGLMANDVFLTVDNYNIHTPEQYYHAIENKTDMVFVVKRMSRSRGEGRRENKIHTFEITPSHQLGLGLTLKGVKSGHQHKLSESFLYVNELREYPNGDAGPGLVAGLRQYDLILKMNDMEIHSIADVQKAMAGEETVECKVRRMIHHFTAYDENESADEIVIINRSPGESLGLSLSESYDHDSVEPFLVVTKVREGGAGYRAGVELRDVIVKIDGKDVHNLDDLKKMISKLDTFKFTVRRLS